MFLLSTDSFGGLGAPVNTKPDINYDAIAIGIICAFVAVIAILGIAVLITEIRNKKKK